MLDAEKGTLRKILCKVVFRLQRPNEASTQQTPHRENDKVASKHGTHITLIWKLKRASENRRHLTVLLAPGTLQGILTERIAH